MNSDKRPLPPPHMSSRAAVPVEQPRNHPPAPPSYPHGPLHHPHLAPGHIETAEHLPPPLPDPRNKSSPLGEVVQEPPAAAGSAVPEKNGTAAATDAANPADETKSKANLSKYSAKELAQMERNLGFKSTFPQEEETQTVPHVTKALECVYRSTKLGVYHGCVVVVGFPATVVWAIIAAIFSFFFTWCMLPFMNMLSVAAKMLLPLLRLPMMLFSEILAPCIEVCVKSCVQVLLAKK